MFFPVCLVILMMVGQSVATTTASTVEGIWELDENQSDSLAPLLQALGAPGIFCRAIARILDKDVLHVNRDQSTVQVKYISSRMLPFKLQKDVTYKIGESVAVYTPTGYQTANLLTNHQTKCSIVRQGPKEGETLEDTFVLHEDGGSLINELRHVSPCGKETRARRVYNRILSC